MNTLDDFFNNAKNINLCERGINVWENCKSKKQLLDIALSGWGLDYVCTAISEGWGISPESIKKDFARFINGGYKRAKDGYTSSMYCGYDGDIVIDTTATAIIDFKGKIIIPQYRVCEIYLCNSMVEIIGEGNGVAYLYNSEVINGSVAPVVIKEKNEP